MDKVLTNINKKSGGQISLAEHKLAKQELAIKDKLLSAAAEAINELVKNLNFDEAVINAFGILGSVIKVDRIILLESFYDKNNNICDRFKHEWCSDPKYSMINDPHTQNIPTYIIPDLVNTLLNKKPLIGNAEDMEPDFRKVMEKCSVCSIMLFPIYIGDYFWGEIGFDDCKAERDWSKSEKAILSLFATSIAGVIERNQNREQEKNAAKKEALLRKITNAIRNSLDLEETLTIICREIALLFQGERVIIVRHPNKGNYEEWDVRKHYSVNSELKGLKDSSLTIKFKLLLK